jgi:type I restriction enzyme M protein
VPENDIPDILTCWENRTDRSFITGREKRLAELKKQITPLKANRLEHHRTIHRLKFEEVVASDPDSAREAREKAEAERAELQARVAPFEKEINQLGRQFWVEKKQVVANKYDLSASTYREVEHEEEFLEVPNVTLSRLAVLESHASDQAAELKRLLETS